MSKLAPLRRVMKVIEVPIGRPVDGKQLKSFHELLECGHHQPFKQDVYGVYHAARRRCRKCQREQKKAEAAN